MSMASMAINTHIGSINTKMEWNVKGSVPLPLIVRISVGKWLNAIPISHYRPWSPSMGGSRE